MVGFEGGGGGVEAKITSRAQDGNFLHLTSYTLITSILNL